MTTRITPERTILTRRPCKHCKNEIYLQHIPVTSKMKWVSFDGSDGRIHSCPVKPLTAELKQRIQEAVVGRSSRMVCFRRLQEEYNSVVKCAAIIATFIAKELNKKDRMG